MDWTRSFTSAARALAGRRLSAVLACAAMAAVLTACSGAGRPTIASSRIAGASQSITASPGASAAPGTSGGGGCPTQGVGGDPIPNLCAPSDSAPAPKGITSLRAPSGSPAPSLSPEVTGISPASGAAAGGVVVTISGTGFVSVTGVEFGTTAAGFTVDPDGQITATSPPGTGTVDVVIVTTGGASPDSAADQFTYAAALSSGSPSSPSGSLS
jgi:IPT/TIG domain